MSSLVFLVYYFIIMKLVWLYLQYLDLSELFCLQTGYSSAIYGLHIVHDIEIMAALILWKYI